MTTVARPMSERRLQEAVIDLVKIYGGRAFHVYDSRLSEPGWPDLVIAFPGYVMYRELKTARGRVTKEQQWWLDTLAAAGEDAGVWRPLDLREHRISTQLVEARRAGRARLRNRSESA